MKIGDLAKRTGLTGHTIRYYERIGLLPKAGRDRAAHRAYDAEILPWIAFLERLKRTGMSLAEMRRYAALRAAGPGTNAARCALLRAHRAAVAAQIAGLTERYPSGSGRLSLFLELKQVSDVVT
jgi:DNA-binding transcriptional MerR regulator